MTYDPRTRRTWEPSPQTEPELFSPADIKAEIRHLRRLNRSFGEHTLRTLAIVKLTRVLAEREVNA